jgi:hypothetical protein
MYSFLLHSPAEACRGARRQLFSSPAAMEKDLPTSLNPIGVPAGRSGEKSIAFTEERLVSTRFLKEETSFYFPAGAAAGDSGANKDERKIHFFRAWRGRN